jgi:hypothetical protein
MMTGVFSFCFVDVSVVRHGGGNERLTLLDYGCGSIPGLSTVLDVDYLDSAY